MASPSVVGVMHPPPISIATPLRDSATFTSTKGLLNGPGQNNCFLNSAVQVLWHLDIFRRSFRDLSGHACMGNSCIFCALKELFSQLQFSNETALPPDALRRALAESFFDQQRFQLGFMDDAAECFENMLLRIHMHIAHGEAEDMCNARHCIPHQKFAMTLIEQSICNSCGATSEPLSYTQMVHYVSTSTLVYQVRANKPQGLNPPFGEVLRKAGSMGDVRVCPSACGAVIQIGRTLVNRPEIVSVGLVWNSERPTLDHIMEVFSSIGTTLQLSHVFNSVVDTRWAASCVHHLVGVVTYYGKHYSTFFFHTKLRVWIYFDDATVREVGPRWEQVVEKCRKGRYQPLLLLYAAPDGTPVHTDQAPTQVTAFAPPLRRCVTPSPEKPVNKSQRRAITPSPECGPKPRLYNDYQNLAVIQSSIHKPGVDQPDAARVNKPPHIHRTLSNGSSSGAETFYTEKMYYPNVPRTRDSGNWSSDRNSASSVSSATNEHPYSGPPRNDSSSSTSSGAGYDVGYDSYSLSSNDSSTMTTIQHLMKMGHLAQIPEDYHQPAHAPAPPLNCDALCREADELLVKSRQLEDDHDLVLALALCNAAATKARAAMDAPYNNPQTLTLARMKHNTCIMRARSLHRRMTQTAAAERGQPEIRHTREGSSGSGGRHSRQGSRDKGQHSRQNSKELVEPQPKPTPIEVYATLPKKMDALKKLMKLEVGEQIYDKPPRESRSIFSRNKSKQETKKRSRSEDRKQTRDLTLTVAPEPKKDEIKVKKQHKIRRKLMGGLIRRKNRSMPDLTEPVDEPKPINNTKDDSALEIKNTSGSSCGYLSEGHLEQDATSPNLERSKLMRKSFHASAGKILTAAKVPPPPPLRTTSQLTSPEVTVQEVAPIYSNYKPQLGHTVLACVEVHQVAPPADAGVDEVDCFPTSPHNRPSFDLPPYPSPTGSAIHSRQASEEFPLPPPPLECEEQPPQPPPGSLLAQLQHKRLEILAHETPAKEKSGDTWLKELQAKQASLRMRKQLDKPDELGNSSTVKDLANKFEVVQIQEVNAPSPICLAKFDNLGQNSGILGTRKREEDVQLIEKNGRNKKKSVSFCDQVILVATADEQEDDSYIPNPILERVLRAAMNKPEAAAICQEVQSLRQAEERAPNKVQRRNSMDNLLQRPVMEEEPEYYAAAPYNTSPYQRIPQNSPIYVQNSPQTVQHLSPSLQNYAPSPKTVQYSQPQAQNSPYMHPPQPRQPPCYSPYQHPPSPYQNSQIGLNGQVGQNGQIGQNSQINQNGHIGQYSQIGQNSQNGHIGQYGQNGQVGQNVQSGQNSQTGHIGQYGQVSQNGQTVQNGLSGQNSQQTGQNGHIGQYGQSGQIGQYSHIGAPAPYQRVPQPLPNEAEYLNGCNSNYSPYQAVPRHYYPQEVQAENAAYYYQQQQRVPPAHVDQEAMVSYQNHQNQNGQYSPYQQVPRHLQMLKKSVSFEAGTKGGCESPTPKAIVTPIMVNNSNMAPTKNKCNLCRKKNVLSSNSYCVDCEFYMSRFKPKR